MKVIGAGLPRTGTMSLQAALNHLGYPCYHMQNVAFEKGHTKMWLDFAVKNKPMDWQNLFQNYEATTDAPVCFFYKELMQEYPQSKLILTVRDPHRWYISLSKLKKVTRPIRLISRKLPMISNFFHFADITLTHYLPHSQDEKDYIEFFHRHTQEVKKNVPPERLLVFQVADGWEPLCNFLGCDVPDIPFPHLNEGDATIKKKLVQIIRQSLGAKIVLGMLAVVAAVMTWYFTAPLL